jgi:uncharacterized membrane protein
MPAVEPILTIVVGLVTIGVVALGVYAGIVLAARVLHRILPATPAPRDPALDALRTRLASGAIDEVEFERLRSVLRRG